MLRPTNIDKPRHRVFHRRPQYGRNAASFFKIPARYYFVLRLTVISFWIYALYLRGFNLLALLSSLLISLPLGYVMAFFEAQAARVRLIFRRQPFWMYLLLRIIRSVLSFSLIICLLLPLLSLMGLGLAYTIFLPKVEDFFRVQYFELLVVALLATMTIGVIDGIKRKLGNASIFNILVGKYHNARHETRIFLFVDLNGSTRLAEEMGDFVYSEFMQDFFYDLGEIVEDHIGEVYQYAGDEVIISWPVKAGKKNNNCIQCFINMKAAFQYYRNYYESQYGHFPDFKGALHLGGISIVEVGKLSTEIAYYGDVLNATSRMVGLCHELKHNLLISGDLKAELKPDPTLELVDLGEFTLRGKSNAIALYGWHRQG